MANNTIYLEITTCCQCPNHYKERIYTADSWEHVTGAYCSKVEDTASCNKRNKLIAEDNWNVDKYMQIPDWCPLLKNKSNDT